MATGQQLDTPAPRPWRIEGQAIWDADGVCIVSAFNPANMATRRLIVEAVNGIKEASLEAARLRFELNAEKEIAVETGKQKLDALFEAARLRDLVRRLAEFIRHGVYDCGGALEIDITSSRDTTDGKRYSYHGNAIDLLREAEAALEGKEAQA